MKKNYNKYKFNNDFKYKKNLFMKICLYINLNFIIVEILFEIFLNNNENIKIDLEN